MVTKAKPRGRPVSREVGRKQSVTSPKGSKVDLSLFSSVSKEMLPM